MTCSVWWAEYDWRERARRPASPPVAATFTRRGIEIPGERPLALTTEFAEDAQKNVQWAAFVRRTRRPELTDLSAIVTTLDRLLWPVLQAAAQGEPWPRSWSNGGPWKEQCAESYN